MTATDAGCVYDLTDMVMVPMFIAWDFHFFFFFLKKVDNKSTEKMLSVYPLIQSYH